METFLNQINKVTIGSKKERGEKSFIKLNSPKVTYFAAYGQRTVPFSSFTQLFGMIPNFLCATA